ncbi:arabinose ABC transporter permease [Corynebacterium sp. HMSC06D04]|nr:MULTISPECIES: MFS transporter [Corynebacterium]OFL98985.1 arabinose ABC transporter permease [Corynebacterium sp. HMSC071F07]OFQ43442.1 arabinose ABC transporter permease [Corynebacterium sp. HMSC076D02]OFR39304.1 arabinose ABC transporter permease [Corynebacterium sp. HMSC077D03]OFT32817.1 arabinose ABC transporter permease [Corynebacterium sp. HMSC08C04]OFT49202.1 arabinose ABC transporter permease [Corynebacterium sp. HMSC06D04]
MVSAAFIIALGYGIIAPLLPQFVVSFDVSMAAAGMVVSIFSASRLIFAPGAGKLVDKFGSRWVYLTGLFTVAITTALVAVAQEYWHIVLFRALAGIGSTMFTVSAMGLIVKLSPPTIRGKCSATYATAFLLGNIIGPLLGASLAFMGFRWPFVLYGAGVALAAVVVWVLMPSLSRDGSAGAALPPMKLSEAWHDTAYRAVLTSNFAQGWINMGVRVSVLPLFAASVFHNGAAASGFALAVFAAGNAVVLQFSGRWADIYGRRPMILIGLVGTGVFVGLMGLADTIPTLLIVSAFAGVASGLINPAQTAAIGDVVGNKRSGGQVLSTFQMAGDFGQILGPIVVGGLADYFGFAKAFAVCAGVAAMGLVAWLCGRETLQERRAIVRRIPLRKKKRL